MDTRLITRSHGVTQVKPALEAIQSQKAVDCEKINLEAALLSSVVMAYEIMGWQATKENLSNIGSMLTDEVLSYVPYIRIEEIPIAVKKGCYGEFGEFVGINVASIIRFLKSYYNSEQRSKLAKDLRPTEETPNLDQDFIRKEEDKIIINAFQKFCLHGSYEDLGNHIYNKLNERGHINFSKDRKLKFMEEAKATINRKFDHSLAMTLEEKRKFGRLIKSITDGSDSGKNMVIREAKQIALSTFFSEIRDMEMDITDLISHHNED